MNTATDPNADLEAPEVISRKLLDQIIAAPEGHLKNASDAGAKMIRRRIRENGYGRLILPFKPVSDGDLSRLPNTELPVMIEEMEPDSPGAKSISFNDSADTAFYRGDKFVVYFALLRSVSQQGLAGLIRRESPCRKDSLHPIFQSAVEASDFMGMDLCVRMSAGFHP